MALGSCLKKSNIFKYIASFAQIVLCDIIMHNDVLKVKFFKFKMVAINS